WFNEVYKKCPGWINQELKRIKPGLFLLCNYDLPWDYDPLRENKELRPYLFEQYKKEMDYYNYSYKIVSGKKTSRLEQAINHVNNFYYG
ncbi:ATPase, partial [Bacteroidota bacterium]